MAKRKATEDDDVSGKRSKANTSVAKQLLESYRKALMSVRDFFEQAAKDLATIDDIELQLKVSIGIANLGEKLGKNIESLDKLEDKVDREEKESTSRRGGTETSMFED